MITREEFEAALEAELRLSPFQDGFTFASVCKVADRLVHALRRLDNHIYGCYCVGYQGRGGVTTQQAVAELLARWWWDGAIEDTRGTLTFAKTELLATLLKEQRDRLGASPADLTPQFAEAISKERRMRINQAYQERAQKELEACTTK